MERKAFPVKKKPERIDTSSERQSLTDNPFAHLGALREALPPGEVPVAVPAAGKASAKAAFKVARTRKGGFNLAIERRSGGKSVTVVKYIEHGAEELLVALKKHCGAGGALREDGIEIQGEHRERIEKFLVERS